MCLHAFDENTLHVGFVFSNFISWDVIARISLFKSHSRLQEILVL